MGLGGDGSEEGCDANVFAAGVSAEEEGCCGCEREGGDFERHDELVLDKLEDRRRGDRERRRLSDLERDDRSCRCLRVGDLDLCL